MKNKPYLFGIAGIVIGGICLTTMDLIEVYGPGSYTSSGSGVLRADGSVTFTVTPLSPLPTIAQTAFYLCLLPLWLSLISFFRKENIFASFGALACGLAPALLMTISIIVVAMLFYGIALPVVGVQISRRLVNKTGQPST